MLIPKPSHLVERVTERLLRSGALDESASQLLAQPAGSPPEAVQDTGSKVPRRSSLFIPSPVVAASANVAAPADGRSDAWSLAEPDEAAANRATPAAAPPGTPQAPPGGVPASPGAALDTAANTPSQSAPSITIHPAAADPAAGPLTGQTFINAVSLERAGMVDWSRTRSRISEEFRLVQRQIIRSAFGPGAEPGFSNLLLVTSARPGEGKSFVATNLAGSIARQGDNHVLLVDADSKRDSICYNLGLSQACGLLDLAANPKLDPAPLIVRTPIDRLSILPVGRERERSAELFSAKEMTRLIQSLGRRYADRLLMLDAPPCLSTSDPAVLSQVVGQILFVVEADRTQRDEIEASLDLIQACPTITLLLNKQQISKRYTFGAYSSYYSS